MKNNNFEQWVRIDYLGKMPQRRKGRKGFKKKIFSELGVFAPWREKYPNSRHFP
jgi:hypothetical protein